MALSSVCGCTVRCCSLFYDGFDNACGWNLIDHLPVVCLRLFWSLWEPLLFGISIGNCIWLLLLLASDCGVY